MPKGLQAEGVGVHYRVHSTMMKKCERWYPTKAEAIAAFERASKRAGIEPPHDYPPDVSGDCFTDNHIDYPYWAAWYARRLRLGLR